MADFEAVRAAVEPVLSRRGLELFDLELVGSGRARTLRLTVDRAEGLDLEALAEATEPVSAALDAAGAVSGSYTLEVSSPGLERKLRTPAHFAAALGKQVRLRTVAGTEGERRVEGELTAADDDGVVLATPGGERRVAYAEVERAKTVFEWGPTPPPGAGRQRRQKVAAGSKRREQRQA